MYPSLAGIALTLAALMGSLAVPRARLGVSGIWLMVAVLGALALNVAASFQALHSARTVALFGAYALLLIFCAGLERTAPLKAAVVLTGAALAVTGLYQSLRGLEQTAGAAAADLPEATLARLESGRAFATLGLPGALGGFLAISLPLTVSWIWRGRNRAARLSGSLLLGLQLAGLVATRSGAAVAALLFATGVVAWCVSSGRRSRWARIGRLSAPALIVAGVAAASLLVWIRLAGPDGVNEGAGPIALRAGNWKAGLLMLAEHPLLGVGAGCYGIAFPAYRTWEMNESRFAHNSYLQLLSEGGLALGGLAVLVAAAFAVLLLRKARRGDSEAVLLAVSCLAFLIHNLVDFTLYLPTLGMTFSCLAGLALRSSSRVSSGGGTRVPPVLGALLLAAFALATARADREIEVARDHVLAGRREAALPHARTAVGMNPLNPEVRSFLSHLLLDLPVPASEENLAEAEIQAVEAIELDPRTPHHWHHLGRVRLARDDPHGAYLAFSRAADLYPIRIEYRQDRDAVGVALAGRAP